ncbi:DUF4297 domain-containing protein [Acinetobacter baumannii]|nr:DUF4297 domain-containing protein [Acinetobacter baumannii]
MTEASEVIQKLFDTLNDEKNGAQAKRGFRFQDWWCTEKLFNTWANPQYTDFALGVEIKEDAVLIDSIGNPKNLEFYQIKKKENNIWRISDLTRPETQDKSILTKLYSRWHSFKPTETKLFFISNSTLKVKVKNKDLFYTDLNFGLDLVENEQKKIKESIIKQLPEVQSEEVELQRIHFLTTNLSLVQADKHVYGVIYDLNDEKKLPITVKNIKVAANYITNVFNNISSDSNYATNLTQILKRCITRKQLEDVIQVIEKKFIDPEDIVKKGIEKLIRENYSHRKLQKLELISTQVLLDLRNRNNSILQSLFKTIDTLYKDQEEILDELNDFSSILEYTSNLIFTRENNGFFSKEYIKCAVILYDISNGEIYCEKYFNI